MRQVTVSYDLPARVVRRVGMGRVSSARFSLSGYDLWSTFSFKGPDPQAEEFGSIQGSLGFEPIPYPPARSYYVGLRLGM
jgi:hypothetical protein